MKERVHKIRKCGVWMAFVLTLCLMFGLQIHVRAAENAGEPEAYDPQATGSITMMLPDKSADGLNREGVQVCLYRVGDLDTGNGYFDFSLTEMYRDVDVDLNDITTGAANETAAQALASFIAADGSIEPAGEVWTGADGKAVFDDLEQGMYLVLQGNINAYGTFNPLVIPVPYAHETGWDYDVEFEPKVNTVTTLGRIEVTKKIKGLYGGMLQDISADSATYHIGLFVDANGEHLYGNAANSIKTVNIMDGSSGTISFDNLPVTEEPYYIFETDADGNPLRYLDVQGTENPFYCMAGEDILAAGTDTAPVITLADEGDSVGNAVITNVYTDELPDGYYYTGDLTITKSVMNDGQMVASDDVFYAGIFPVDAQGNVGATPVDIVKLNNNASVTVEVPLGGTDGTQPVTYAVRETNEQGVPVSQDSSFLYEVTGEGNVNLSLDQTTGAVNITNTLSVADGYYQEPSTQAPNDPGTGNDNSRSNANDNRSNNDGNGSQNRDTSSGTGRSSSSARTGDDNQIFLYAGLLAAAVIVGGVVVMRRRRRG